MLNKLCITLLLPLSILAKPPVVSQPKPNIVFIYADDMGWTGTSVEMIKGDASTKSDFYRTPNLEKLATKGMVFSQAYSPGPLCTPSRAAVLTGKTPAELHITTPGGGRSETSRRMITPKTENRLPDNTPTIGTILKAEGYTTALLGKWHIGRRDHAGMHGFDVHDGSTENEDKGTDEDPKEIFSLTERGIAFMKENVKSGKPFYLQLSHYAVHSPIQTRPESLEKFKKLPSGGTHIHTDYAAMTWDLDDSIGQIFQAVKKLDIENNTYIVFMSDNGASGNRRKPNNTPLYAGKGSLYEGGIRVPLIISGPGINTGYCTEPVNGTDLLPTFASWTEAKIEIGEGEDLTPLLTGKAPDFNRRNALLFHYPHYGNGPQVPQTALVMGDWKLLRNWEEGSDKLYNLKSDIGESTDLSSKEPEMLKRMIAGMEARLTETKAQLPEANPDYNPNTESQRRGKDK
jgi:arylsulfatase A-like enzyme